MKKLHRRPDRSPQPIFSFGNFLAAGHPVAAFHRADTWRDRLLAALCFLPLVILMWAPSIATSGMPYETEFVYSSDSDGPLAGFFYWPFLLRLHIRFFFHLSWLIGEALGISGSYVPYTAMYAALWWFRGLVVFMLLERFLPAWPAFRFLAGALVIFHAADRSLLWIGQMNQQGFLLWILLSFSCLVAAYQSPDPLRRAACMLGGMFFQHLTLWTYESPIFVICAAPLLLLPLRPKRNQWIRFTAAWAIVPATYAALTLRLYMVATNIDYQSSMLRKDLTAANLTVDFFYNLWHTLNFWRWQDVSANQFAPQGLFYLVTLSAVFFFAGLALFAVRQFRAQGAVLPAPRSLLAVAAAGLLYCAFSFPPYLILEDARTAWRTLLLSGPGAMVALAAGIALLAGRLPGRRLPLAAAILLALPAGLFGAKAALHFGAAHRHRWEIQRVVVAGIINAAPRLQPYTLVFLLNMPKQGDPFGENLWFDKVFRLYNPGVPVAGAYFHEDGTPSVDNHWAIENGEWVWKRPRQPQMFERTCLQNTLLIDYSGGHPRVLNQWTPAPFAGPELTNVHYNPALRIIPEPPVPQAVRRYGPL